MEGHWSSVSNYSGGEAVGGSWTDKVLAAKASSVESSDKAGDDVIGDDEWVYLHCSTKLPATSEEQN